MKLSASSKNFNDTVKYLSKNVYTNRKTKKKKMRKKSCEDNGVEEREEIKSLYVVELRITYIFKVKKIKPLNRSKFTSSY